jgi:hypothetical protein
MLNWTTVPNVQAYYLYVGTTLGAKDLVKTGETWRMDWPACDMPLGQLLYARIWTKINGVWSYGSDISFTATALPRVRQRLRTRPTEPRMPI